MKISIQTKPQNEMRYDTWGDWRWEEDVLMIEVVENEVPTLDHQFLIALHELVEAYLCFRRGITQESVDAFDMNWKGKPDEEPGDDPKAPYGKEHRFAMLMEHLMAKELGLNSYGTVR